MIDIETRTTKGFMEFTLEGRIVDTIWKGENAMIDETINHLEEIIEQLKTYKND